jgi:HSP20 family protein
MSTQIVPSQGANGTSAEMTDWPGSPLSTLHHQATTAPIRTETYVKDGRYVVRFELPGIDPETRLDVSVEANVLSVHAERPSGDGGKYHSEFRYGLFDSHITLPPGADTSDVTAACEKGILEVSVGLEGSGNVRKIKVVTAEKGQPA